MATIADMAGGIFTRYDRQVWILVAGAVINIFGTSIAYPFISLYLFKYRGVSMTDVGFALLLAAVAGSIAQIAGGEACDRLGRKVTMNAGLSLQMVAFALLAYAIYSDMGYVEFLLLMMLKESAGGLYRNVPMVMVADTVEPGDRTGAFSLLRIGHNLGFALGPIFGGLLASYSYTIMFAMTALTSGAFLLISLYLLHDTRPCEGEVRTLARRASFWKDTPFLMYCAIGVAGSLVYSQLFTTFGTFAGGFVHIPELEVGLIFSLNGVMVVFFQYPVATFLERFRLTTSLALGSILYAIGFSMVGFCAGFWTLSGSMFIITLGELVVSPPTQVLIAKMAPPEARGRYMSISSFFSSAGSACGPAFGGMLMDRLASSIAVMWIILGALELACATGYLLLRLRLSIKMDAIEPAGVKLMHRPGAVAVKK